MASLPEQSVFQGVRIKQEPIDADYDTHSFNMKQEPFLIQPSTSRDLSYNNNIKIPLIKEEFNNMKQEFDTEILMSVVKEEGKDIPKVSYKKKKNKGCKEQFHHIPMKSIDHRPIEVKDYPHNMHQIMQNSYSQNYNLYHNNSYVHNYSYAYNNYTNMYNNNYTNTYNNYTNTYNNYTNMYNNYTNLHNNNYLNDNNYVYINIYNNNYSQNNDRNKYNNERIRKNPYKLKNNTKKKLKKAAEEAARASASRNTKKPAKNDNSRPGNSANARVNNKQEPRQPQNIATSNQNQSVRCPNPTSGGLLHMANSNSLDRKPNINELDCKVKIELDIKPDIKPQLGLIDPYALSNTVKVEDSNTSLVDVKPILSQSTSSVNLNSNQPSTSGRVYPNPFSSIILQSQPTTSRAAVDRPNTNSLENVPRNHGSGSTGANNLENANLENTNKDTVNFSDTSKATDSINPGNTIVLQNNSIAPNLNETFSKNTAPKETKKLTVLNLPMIWSLENLENFFDMADVEKPVCTTLIRCEHSKTATLEFESMEVLMHAKSKLSGLELGGRKLEIQGGQDIPDGSDVSDSGDKVLWRPDLDINQRDPKGLYGLRRKYLKSLQITPPLEQWVKVTNFDCDKAALCELLQSAGRVVICDFSKIGGFNQAQVMYSHPLEAVQAISMLHNKPDSRLHVVMDTAPDKMMAPFRKNELKRIEPTYNILGELGKHLKGLPTRFCDSMFYEPQVLVPQLYDA